MLFPNNYRSVPEGLPKKGATCPVKTRQNLPKPVTVGKGNFKVKIPQYIYLIQHEEYSGNLKPVDSNRKI
ncbi:hypothetical protein MKJ01_18630 [Chryseobacterium sp. SSA4.19]|uniref:hypothetical protein n=1 Tax=Chryseobacterium sp. SSA4.19 TaxID=2919915 RepID=UPI001F4EE48F|nr:hypothetical protein [Chryseobacterium sp. SSA4.19]MCJ8155770.1 hypothetical protein [Chryseobacterium sp. SSA4.19]